MEMFYRNLKSFSHVILVNVLSLGMSGCVWFDFPDDPPVMNPPVTEVNACSITVVRKKQFAGSGITQTISIDDQFVANLKSNQYTKFNVSIGRHVIGTAWRIGGIYIIGPGGGLGQDISDFYKQELLLDCIEDNNFFLTIEAKGISLHENDRIIFKRVDSLTEGFSLEGKEFIPTGEKPTP